MTQAELSKRSGVKQPMISMLEAERKNVVSPAVRKVLAALGAELEFVIVKVHKRR